MIVKICGITNPADARACAEAGADVVGLMFFEASSRYVPPPVASEIVRELPPFVLKAGVFVNAPEEFVMEAIATCGLNLLQFHGDETPEYCAGFPLPVIKAFRLRDADSLKPLVDFPTSAWLLDSWVADKPGGTGAKFNWELAVAAKELGRPVFLAGGLTPENVAEAVRQVRPYGVDVSSGVENAPGRKDHQKVRDFIQAAKAA
jgi:phosphoribosylanthranilate isomerase